MPFATIDGIATRYEVMGDGPPLLMFSPGGFDATLEKWASLGIYGKTRMLGQLVRHYSCIMFDRTRPASLAAASSASPGRITLRKARGCSITWASCRRI